MSLEGQTALYHVNDLKERIGKIEDNITTLKMNIVLVFTILLIHIILGLQ